MNPKLLLVASPLLVVACAGSSAEVTALQKAMRALEGRVARAESRNEELKDRVFVMSAQVDECRTEWERKGPPASRSSASPSSEPIADSAYSDEPLLDPTLPRHLQVVALEPEAYTSEPVELRIHGDPPSPVIDVTDVPPPPSAPDPGVAAAEFDSGLRAFRTGDFRGARSVFESFVDTYPVDAKADNAMYWVGECSYELGDFADALTAFRRIVNEYPQSRKVADAMFKIGASYEQLKDGRNARRAFEKLVKRYPNSAYAELARSRLK